MDIVFTELTLNYLTVTLLAAALSAFALFDLRKGPLQPLRRNTDECTGVISDKLIHVGRLRSS